MYISTVHINIEFKAEIISYVAHLIHHILIPDVADMLQFIFSEKRVKNLKQTLI
jgi:hypothetical protein